MRKQAAQAPARVLAMTTLFLLLGLTARRVVQPPTTAVTTLQHCTNPASDSHQKSCILFDTESSLLCMLAILTISIV